MEEILHLAKEHSFSATQNIIEKGKLNDSLWIIVEGKAVVRDHLPQGLDINLHLALPGEILGEYSFVDHVPASADVAALELTRTVRFRFSDLQEFFSRHPECELKTYKQLARIMSRRLRTANRELKRSFLTSMGWEQSMNDVAETQK